MVVEGKLKKQREHLFDLFNSKQIDERELERHLNLDEDEAKKNFPIKFWIDVVTENVENGNSTKETIIYKEATLQKNKANAIINKEEVLDWLLEYFGDKDNK